uniref:Elongation of fatty acids protein n=1 Tax=Chromera velia CCMP2878 TaxID=1169474 RepID=A0A0G4ICN9_9ALVE|eukprot:Cvel_13090.t1-p1 / transcript=Cvel_13090.t1 / gene=Cvel_13090 / organism=Chromera_velia_CCMP2878 / gene_product=Putative fatty acid elongation protein 4, putative / transcript_product=Putative fatty acid elongation protein 4, putative / location=Cvel_scaffold881:57057-59478(+) / protein_length=525 / sequence_SO=supercontig / SO=protein_coding / is_pseudo=false
MISSLQAFMDMWQEPGAGSRLAESLTVPLLTAIALYIPVIALIAKLTSSHKKYELKWFSIFWYGTLSFFSGLGAFLMMRDDASLLLRVYQPEAGYKAATRAVVALFCLTKSVEFGDTVLLVLKKRPVSFLHGFHHFTVALYCWHAQLVNVSFAHLFVLINLCVHCVMYGYYTLSTLIGRGSAGGVRAMVSKVLFKIRPMITSFQLIQMFVGSSISWRAAMGVGSLEGLPEVESNNAVWALAMYASYAVLFGHFFVKSYLKKWAPAATVTCATMLVCGLSGLRVMLCHSSLARLLLEVVVMCEVGSVWRLMSGATRAERRAQREMSVSASVIDTSASQETQKDEEETEVRHRSVDRLSSTASTSTSASSIQQQPQVVPSTASSSASASSRSTQRFSLAGHIRRRVVAVTGGLQEDVAGSDNENAHSAAKLRTAQRVTTVAGLVASCAFGHYVHSSAVLGFLVHGCMRLCAEVLLSEACVLLAERRRLRRAQKGVGSSVGELEKAIGRETASVALFPSVLMSLANMS